VREDDADPEPLNDDGLELADGAMVALAVKPEDPVEWSHLHSNLNIDGKTLVKSQRLPFAGMAEAISRQVITKNENEEQHVSFEVEMQSHISVGLASTDSGKDKTGMYSACNFEILVGFDFTYDGPPEIKVRENGNGIELENYNQFLGYEPGGELSIRVKGGQVRYYTSKQVASFPLGIQASLYDVGDKVINARLL
jgi:hypothetical protein